ncbi:hypothetical protein KEM54_006682, partial [Ascosphaera aggregata]
MTSPSNHNYVPPSRLSPPISSPNVLQPIKPAPSFSPGVALPTASRPRLGSGDAMTSPSPQQKQQKQQQQQQLQSQSQMQIHAQAQAQEKTSPLRSSSSQDPNPQFQTESLLDAIPPLPMRPRTFSTAASSCASSPAPSSAGGGASALRGRATHSANASRSSTHSPQSTNLTADVSDDIRSLIIRGLSPVIGVFASPDTDEMIKLKGFRNGLRELLQPFGENIPGKIVIRDSASSSRSWEDYAVRFVDLPPTKRLRGSSLSSFAPSPTVTSPTMPPSSHYQPAPLPPLTQLE